MEFLDRLDFVGFPLPLSLGRSSAQGKINLPLLGWTLRLRFLLGVILDVNRFGLTFLTPGLKASLLPNFFFLETYL